MVLKPLLYYHQRQEHEEQDLQHGYYLTGRTATMTTARCRESRARVTEWKRKKIMMMMFHYSRCKLSSAYVGV
jgi:hypothetical protein